MKKYEISKELSVEVSSSSLGKSYYVYKNGKHIATFNEGSAFNGKGGDVNINGNWRTYKTDKGFDKAAAQHGFSKQDVIDAVTNFELIACIDDYIVDVDAAAEVEIENVEEEKTRSELFQFSRTLDEKVTNLCEITSQDGKIFTREYLAGENKFWFDLNRDGSKYEILACWLPVAKYDTIEQAADVLLKLVDDVKVGKTTFKFPTQEEYNRIAERKENLQKLKDTQKFIRGCMNKGDVDSAESLANYAKYLLAELAA